VIAHGVKALENGCKGTNAISLRRPMLDVESVRPSVFTSLGVK